MKKFGISLIVLVITIIVMIILAGAIILSLSNGNVIAKAKEAKEASDITQIREMIDIEKTTPLLAGTAFSSTDATTINAKIPSAYVNDIFVSNLGVPFLKPNVNTKITDPGAAIEKLGGAFMPTGFTHLEGDLDTGIVIKNTTDNNEFVWVPVPNISEFIRANVTTWAAIGGTYKGYDTIVDVNQQPAEYKAMYASVLKYHGFYIARYEAGIPSGVTQAAPASDTTATWGVGGTMTPVSKPDKFVWNYIKWSTIGNELTSPTQYAGDPSTSGAVKAARAMYPVGSATVGMPVSTLVYGEQWDAAMRYMKDVTNVQNASNKYITDSTGMGNNTAIIAKSGASSAYKVKNIYDMAGNLSEFTMEAYGTDHRVMRGGNYFSLVGTTPASNRSIIWPDSNNTTLGFRPALYIK